MQGTFIGVLMSATLPARLGEPSRALIVARRLGRARETLPVVLGTMVSQTLLEPARAGDPRRRRCSRASSALDGHHRALLIAGARAARGAAGRAARAGAAAPARPSRARARLQALLLALRRSLARLRDGLRVFRHPRRAAVATRRCSWARGRCSGCRCWLLLMALGLDVARGRRRRRRRCCSRSTSPR